MVFPDEKLINLCVNFSIILYSSLYFHRIDFQFVMENQWLENKGSGTLKENEK